MESDQEMQNFLLEVMRPTRSVGLVVNQDELRAAVQTARQDGQSEGLHNLMWESINLSKVRWFLNPGTVRAVEEEATKLAQVFPQVPRDRIVSLLKKFIDFHQRREIVMRLLLEESILKLEERRSAQASLKRGNPQQGDEATPKMPKLHPAPPSSTSTTTTIADGLPGSNERKVFLKKRHKSKKSGETPSKKPKLRPAPPSSTCTTTTVAERPREVDLRKVFLKKRHKSKQSGETPSKKPKLRPAPPSSTCTTTTVAERPREVDLRKENVADEPRVCAASTSQQDHQVPHAFASGTAQRCVSTTGGKLKLLMNHLGPMAQGSPEQFLDALDTPSNGCPVFVPDAEAVLIQPNETKPEPIEIKQEPIEIKQEPIEINQEPIEIKQEPMEIKQEPIEINQEPVEIKQEVIEEEETAEEEYVQAERKADEAETPRPLEEPMELAMLRDAAMRAMPPTPSTSSAWPGPQWPTPAAAASTASTSTTTEAAVKPRPFEMGAAPPGVPSFDLVEQLHQVTGASRLIIRLELQRLRINYGMKPSEDQYDWLVDRLLVMTNGFNGGLSSGDDDDDGMSLTTSEVSSSDETEPYSLELDNPAFGGGYDVAAAAARTPDVVAPPADQPMPQPRKRWRTREPQNAAVNPNNILDLTVTPEEERPGPSTIQAAPVAFAGPAAADAAAKAASPAFAQQRRRDDVLVLRLCEIFPDASKDYIRAICEGKSLADVDGLITRILDGQGDYPKRPARAPSPQEERTPEEQLQILLEFLPDADPDYLRMLCDRYQGQQEALMAAVYEAIDRKNYPTLKEAARKQQISAQQRQYTDDFSVEAFVRLIPNPSEFFADPGRTVKMDVMESHYAVNVLRNTFDVLPVRTIQSAFKKARYNCYAAAQQLKKWSNDGRCRLKSKRPQIRHTQTIANIPLLQELAYVKNEQAILEYIESQKAKAVVAREMAKQSGLMKTCGCCFEEEVLPEDAFGCPNGCLFCRDCVTRSTEVLFGEGKVDFPCLANCPAQFSLQTLQAALPPKFFSKVAQKKAMAEVKAAGIEDLETCPFCDFATIPPEGDRIFACLNPECMKQSCRQCREPSHIPLRCDEIEKDDDVRARVLVENRMTEALLRECHKCGVKFFKEEGCNKMSCRCGAVMCYVCGQPVKDYKHFNGQGGDRHDLCPLYSDTNKLNEQNVLRGAAAARHEIGNKELKIDPTKDVHEHYRNRAKALPRVHGYLNNLPAIEAHLINMQHRYMERERGRAQPAPPGAVRVRLMPMEPPRPAAAPAPALALAPAPQPPLQLHPGQQYALVPADLGHRPAAVRMYAVAQYPLRPAVPGELVGAFPPVVVGGDPPVAGAQREEARAALRDAAVALRADARRRRRAAENAERIRQMAQLVEQLRQLERRGERGERGDDDDGLPFW